MRRHSHHHEHAGERRGSGESVVPKLIGLLAVFAVLRAIMAGKRHGGRSGWLERRREAIAALHRELHKEDAAKATI